VAPILPGQKATAPPSQATHRNNPPSKAKPAAPQPDTGDLIDFGSGTATPQPPENAQKQPVARSNQDLLGELYPEVPGRMAALHRTDTETDSVDEFVDATS
jgi:hypothetical protein